jgi:hypothetical protein
LAERRSTEAHDARAGAQLGGKDEHPAAPAAAQTDGGGKVAWEENDPDDFDLHVLDRNYAMLRVAEHSAQVPADARERIENQFKGQSRASPQGAPAPARSLHPPGQQAGGPASHLEAHDVGREKLLSEFNHLGMHEPGIEPGSGR